jgi:hypothetical protein
LARLAPCRCRPRHLADDGTRCQAAVRSALEVGYRHLDTATIYRNERDVGRAIRDSRVPREQVFITTKLPPGNAGREQRTLTESLRALGMDHVDLWLVHWPALARTRGNSRTGLRPGRSPRSASMPGRIGGPEGRVGHAGQQTGSNQCP